MRPLNIRNIKQHLQICKAIFLKVFGVFTICIGNAQGVSDAYTLFATKNKRHHIFSPGDKILVRFREKNSEKEFKGILKELQEDSIYTWSFKKHNRVIKPVSADEIIPVMTLLRKDRRASGILTGASLAMASPFIFPDTNGRGSGYSQIFVALAGAGAALSAISFFTTYPFQAVNKQSLNSGWEFQLRKYSILRSVN